MSSPDMRKKRAYNLKEPSIGNASTGDVVTCHHDKKKGMSTCSQDSGSLLRYLLDGPLRRHLTMSSKRRADTYITNLDPVGKKAHKNGDDSDDSGDEGDQGPGSFKTADPSTLAARTCVEIGVLNRFFLQSMWSNDFALAHVPSPFLSIALG